MREAGRAKGTCRQISQSSGSRATGVSCHSYSEPRATSSLLPQTVRCSLTNHALCFTSFLFRPSGKTPDFVLTCKRTEQQQCLRRAFQKDTSAVNVAGRAGPHVVMRRDHFSDAPGGIRGSVLWLFFFLSVLHPLETIYRPISILSHAALSGIGMETLLASPK